MAVPTKSTARPCQLRDIDPAVAPLSETDRVERALARAVGRIERKGLHVLNGIASSLRALLPAAGTGAAVVEAEQRSIVRPALGLQAGERVLVRSKAEIIATLDANGCTDGLGFMPVMQMYCGKELAVKKRIDRFFDERTRRMLKVRDVVILDGAFCESSPFDYEDYAGCDRCCFLFWKEAWLRRP